MGRDDPGPCPICGAPHTACTVDSGPILVVQTPERDALAARHHAASPAPDPPQQQTFSTKTYRGEPKRRR